MDALPGRAADGPLAGLKCLGPRGRLYCTGAGAVGSIALARARCQNEPCSRASRAGRLPEHCGQTCRRGISGLLAPLPPSPPGLVAKLITELKRKELS